MPIQYQAITWTNADPQEQHQWNLNQNNLNLVRKKNAFEDAVGKMLYIVVFLNEMIGAWKYVKNMVVDAQAPCVARSSASLLLAMKDYQVISKEEF